MLVLVGCALCAVTGLLLLLDDRSWLFAWLIIDTTGLAAFHWRHGHVAWLLGAPLAVIGWWAVVQEYRCRRDARANTMSGP